MATSKLAPLADADLSSVEAVFTDVDGTLTLDGKITSTTLKAIEWLKAVGVPTVLVSGRPAGWGEAWVRQWPVAGAIMENGGVAFTWRDGRVHKRFAQGDDERLTARRHLEKQVRGALLHVKGAKLSIDAPYREVDLAIDYAEDVQLGHDAADRLEAFLTRRGVTAVRSSVHVNCWVGDFDKRWAVRRFLRLEWKRLLEVEDRRWVYVGDSFNDAPMFEAFALSIGVANVRDVLDRLDAPPKYVTRAREARGFGEVADAIVRARRKRRKS